MRKWALLTFCVFVFAVSAAPRLQASGFMITEVTHNASQPLHPGDFINVTLKGTPGGKAWFDLGAAATGVPMSEVSPGVYVGAYQIPKGTHLSNAAVIGHLQVGSRTALRLAPLPVTVLSSSPTAVQLNPPDQSTVASTRPSIYALFDTTTHHVNPQSLHFYLDDREISGDATLSPYFAAYTPPNPLLAGNHAVRIIGQETNGENFEEDWSFTIGSGELPPEPKTTGSTPAPAVSVSVSDAGGPLAPGETLTVILTGPSGGSASFDIGTVHRDLPMSETSTPGTYLGNYTIQNDDDFQNAAITGRLSMPDGSVLSAKAPTPLNLQAPLAVTLLEPADGSEVSSSFTIRGKTKPDARVTLTIQMSQPIIPGYYNIKESTKTEQLRADDQGNFEMELSTTAFKGTQYTINAVAHDAKGDASPPVTVTVTQR